MAVEGYSNQDWRAGAVAEGSYSPTQLFTAEDDIKTNAGLVKAGQVLAVLTIVAVDADDLIVPWVPGAVDTTANPIGVLACDMNTGAANGGYNANTYAPYYEGACFNPDLLVWPAGLATYEERKMALANARANFRVKRLL